MHKKVSRSVRLRKYEAVYEIVCKKPLVETTTKVSKKQASPKKPKRSPPKRQSSPVKSKRPLNAYQKFVQEESKKTKYKGMLATERLSAVSKAWNDQKHKPPK